MAKIKLMRFELLASIEERKKLTEFLQVTGKAHIEKVQNEELAWFDTEGVVAALERELKTVLDAISILELHCELKKSFIASFSDYSQMQYREFKEALYDAKTIKSDCFKIKGYSDKISEKEYDILRYKALIDYYRPWEKLDIPMSSKKTFSTSIFIGTFRDLQTKASIKSMIALAKPDFDGFEVEIIDSSPVQTCAVIVCHSGDGEVLESVLKEIGFTPPENPASKPPKKAIEELENLIQKTEKEIEELKNKIISFSDKYEKIRFLSDYYNIQIERLQALSLAGATKNTIYFEGYIPERDSEDIKFLIEKDFTAQMELFEATGDDVPVLIENSAFAGGVENISNMYSPPSNNDVDPNPIMAFFYYSLFGLMLSDAGYGLLMVIFALVAKYKVKVQGSTLKTVNFAFFCGISTMIWGALFGSWFGDLIPTVCTTFFGMENPPNLVIWFDPKDESMKLLMYSFLFGIIHLFVGLAIRFYNLCKHKDFLGAICDVIPVYIFVTGFAIVGKNFIEPVSENVRETGIRLLVIGAVQIILTAGRSAKNIFGKLGGGFYGLYNTTTGYLGDILSYSRLLALNLVTGVIAIVVNLLASMPGNIIIFILIFLVGHAINFAINLIGTYVHTNRLQYVEYFSKFYEGGGKSFTPFKLNSKYIKFKEDTIND